MIVNEELVREKAKQLELLLLDVDGVFTDGGIILAGKELEAKKFDVQDGMGVTMAQLEGMEVGIITGRVSEAVRRRAEELSIEEVHQGPHYKDETLEEILRSRDFGPSKVAYIGDDIQDLPLLTIVGFPIAPANAREEVKQHCIYVTNASGGDGAIRETVEYLLELRGTKQEVYEYFGEVDQ